MNAAAEPRSTVMTAKSSPGSWAKGVLASSSCTSALVPGSTCAATPYPSTAACTRRDAIQSGEAKPPPTSLLTEALLTEALLTEATSSANTLG
ncbi:MAG: hypothetical protein IPL40_11965 [Proteobacteria bacterium]|nr:hypothetical protein [Pseudomonadota bacterium]